MKNIEKMHFSRKDFVLGLGVFFIALLLTLGFGYFIGRAEQIELNKKSLIKIPDINHCFSDAASSSEKKPMGKL